MKIKWIGKYNGTNLPVVPVEESMKVLPEVKTKHALALIPILLGLSLCVIFKNRVLHERVLFTREMLADGFFIGIMLFPVHELLHAVCFPPGSEIFMFFTNKGLGTTCTSPMTRNRFIFVNLFPSIVLGFIPLLLYLITPKVHSSIATIMFAIAFLHIGGSYADYTNILHLLRIPAKTTIQISGERIYWKDQI